MTDIISPAADLAADTSASVEIVDLGKRYGPEWAGTQAVAGVDLSIASGEFVAIVGASGCGKSTVLRILAGFEEASSGSVSVGGAPVTRPGPDRGVVFQDYGLFPWLTVRENIAYGPRRRRLPRARVNELVDRFLAAVGLTRFAAKYPGQLSGGMQQRVAIARVLANEPRVLLMDEPFGALDALTRSDLQAELKRIHLETRTTVVFITHSIEEAVFLADRVVVMTGGASHGVPGHISRIVEIDLPPQRDILSPAFTEYKRIISDLVHEPVAAA
ncbi:sulfonate ABC transporter ATP-binding protein [Microbacterium sp. SGAir0570]|uniref:ABC transporter ATP-binding protein n=1 Tax=unclassified Microbacterium TaxID=2609290 RepID=UPI0010CCB606|nr:MULTISPECIES: ABC transporter ATP-binding protein [unclassified Microbacterium]QCR39113.1 sulfonate ABC transporter ATP-binding protein [Microbacterium sp. SGAir0570]